VLLVLEDVHWGDETLLDVLRGLHVTPLSGEALVIATARETVAGLPELALPKLTSDEVRRVVEQTVNARPDDALLALLVERSAGNPLWLVECLRLLSERGQLTVEGDRAVVREGHAEIEVPASIRLIVSARVDSLPTGQKIALQRASAWPAGIPDSEWPGSPSQLTPLMELGLIDRDQDGRLRFSHGLVREAIYGSMPRAARVTEHEGLLTRSTDPAARAYSALEIHRLEISPDSERRQAIAHRALTAVVAHAQHLRLSHTRAARDVLLRQEPLVNELDLVAPAACAVFLTELADVLQELEQRAASRAAATRAVALADVAQDAGIYLRARLSLGESLLGTDNEAARQIADVALTHLEGREFHPVSARAWRLLANAHSYDDLPEMQRCLELAFLSAERAADQDAAASTARRVAFNLSVTADAEFDRWLEIATSRTPPEHLRGQAELALIRSVVAQARGEWEISWKEATKSMALAEQVGMHHRLVDAAAVATEAATATGRREALPGLIARLTSLTDGHRARLRLTALCAITPALVLLGREQDAARALVDAATQLPALGPNEALMVWSARGHCAAMLGRHVEAEEAFTLAETLAQDQAMSLFALGCRLHRLTAQVHQGGHAGSRAQLLSLSVEFDAARATPHAETARALAASLTE
jgi:hypothetical protein